MSTDNWVVLAWALFALAGALLAPYRRRSQLEGGLLGLLLGPIGLAVVLLWPGKPEPASQPAVPSE